VTITLLNKVASDSGVGCVLMIRVRAFFRRINLFQN
jgi:hypothetical protein